jgi:chromosome segregation ATPase
VSLETEIAEARGQIVSRDGELEDLRSQLNEANAESERAHTGAAAKVRELEQQLESERVQAELLHLCALERLRAEHQLAIQREKDAMDEERKRMSAWVQDVKDSCDKASGGTC